MSKELTPLQQHQITLENFKPALSKVLPPHMTVDRVVRNVVNALAGNKYLQTVDKTSIMQAAMTSAVLGLDVDNVTGQGYIVPFKGKAQFIVGYKGYISLAANAGYLVSGEVVREKDFFNWKRGLNPDLIHNPGPGGPDQRGPIKYVYATARHRTLPADFVVLHVDQINALRDRSEGYKAFLKGNIKSTPWETDYEAMAAKTAIRAMAPKLPLNVQKAAALEGTYERGQQVSINEHGSLVVDQNQDSGDTKEQPNLSSSLGLEPIDQCPACGGTRKDDAGNPCKNCNY